MNRSCDFLRIIKSSKAGLQLGKRTFRFRVFSFYFQLEYVCLHLSINLTICNGAKQLSVLIKKISLMQGLRNTGM